MLGQPVRTIDEIIRKFYAVLADQGNVMEALLGVNLEQLTAACVEDESVLKPRASFGAVCESAEIVHVFGGGSTLISDRH